MSVTITDGTRSGEVDVDTWKRIEQHQQRVVGKHESAILEFNLRVGLDQWMRSFACDASGRLATGIDNVVTWRKIGMLRNEIIAIDFDGTIVTHEYPEIGKPVPLALETLRALQADGRKLILWTMRDKETLRAAIDYCKAGGIEFWGVNGNPKQDWSESPKAYAQLYIDDAAYGCPLLQDVGDKRPYVDWRGIAQTLGVQI